LNLALNQTFADQIALSQYTNDSTGYRAGSRLLQIFETILRAENLLKVLAPGKTQIIAKDASNNEVVIGGDDDIEIRVNILQNPVIKPAPLAELTQSACPLSEGGNCVTPRIKVEFGDLELSIYGKKCLVRSSVANGYKCTSAGITYLMAKVKASIVSKADFGFKAYSNPKNDPAMAGLTAVSLEISETDLKYTLQVLEGTDNPLGLNPNGIFEVLDPTVKHLVVPLLNYVLEEIPLPKLEACGVSLLSPSGSGSALQTVPIKIGDYTSGGEFILVNTKLGTYTYGGNCKL